MQPGYTSWCRNLSSWMQCYAVPAAGRIDLQGSREHWHQIAVITSGSSSASDLALSRQQTEFRTATSKYAPIYCADLRIYLALQIWRCGCWAVARKVGTNLFQNRDLIKSNTKHLNQKSKTEKAMPHNHFWLVDSGHLCARRSLKRYMLKHQVGGGTF